ncbi:hypothetical protein JCM10003_870 [Bacteroides pyogenes JCM 10003]|nr:hypothetical protein [Bacteroides pyogenes]GAE21421.1 hypothetical protein JCM10003_870 [Bacteroides pyogenes JCM 10003]SUV33860.1 Uncharacterised protein [Bacteroides pyogenes]
MKKRLPEKIFAFAFKKNVLTSSKERACLNVKNYLGRNVFFFLITTTVQKFRQTPKNTFQMPNLF